MPKRIARKKLKVEHDDKLLNLQVETKLILYMDEGSSIDVSYLDQNLFNSSEVIKELNIFLRGQAGKRSMASSLLQYLKFVSKRKLKIGAASLSEFKKHLDKKKNKLNTKSQLFSLSKRFTKHLMASGDIPHEDLPSNFKHEEPQHKITFINPVRYDLDAVTKDLNTEVDFWIEKRNLEKPEAQALAYGLACMSAIKKSALIQIKKYEEDAKYVDEVIEEITEKDKSLLKNADFSNLDDHCDVQVIKFLYINYGRALPSKGWEKLSDWWRKKPNGWSVTRIRSAFFPTIPSLEAYFVLTLANELLLPNVDGVRKYMYLDCCLPSTDKKYYDFFIGKKRGTSKTVSISKNDELVNVIRKLSKRLKRILPEIDGGNEYLKTTTNSIFVHFYLGGSNKKGTLKNIDPSTSSYLVKRFIKNASSNYEVLIPLIDKISGENFRPTHSYLKSISGLSIYQIQKAMHHKNTSTTRGYLNRVETQSIANRKKKEFQKFIIHEATKLKRTGSGYYCDFKNYEEKNCVQYIDCIDCEAKRIVFDSVQLTAEWLSWEKKLIEEKESLIFENSQRWFEFWEPKLAEYQFLISQVNRVTLESAKNIKLVLPCIN